MYTSFKIENFRGFRQLEIDDLARVNLIAGKNNVGKSSLLEALFIHAGRYNPELATRVNNWRGITEFRIDYGSRTPWWDSLFHNFDSNQIAEFVNTDEANEATRVCLSILKAPEELAKIVDLVRQNTPGSNTLVSATNSLRALKLKTQLLDHEMPHEYYIVINEEGVRTQFTPPPPFQTMYLGGGLTPSIEQNAQSFSEQVSIGNRDVFIESLKFVEERLTNLELLNFNGQTMIHGYIGDIRPVPVIFMGDGINRLISILLAISASHDGMLLLDEIENGFHYSSQVDVWKAINQLSKQFNVQVFATTHSLEMIRAAHIAFSEADSYDFRLHRLNRNQETGEIYPVTYDQGTMEAALDMNLEVR